MLEQTLANYRLSPQQRHLWLQQQGGGVYGAQSVVGLEGELDAASLREAARAVVRRHEILRTSFERVPGVKFPYQVLSETAAPAWREISLAGLGDRKQRAEVERLLNEEARLVSTEGQPLRCVLVALDAARHVLLVSLPALCADSLTLHNFARELARSYSSLVAGEVEAETEEAVQYVQFSEWQHELMDEEGAAEGAEFWRCLHESAASSDSAALTLPLELAGPEAHGDATARLAREIGGDVLRGLEEVAAANGAGLATVLLAGWAALLLRLTSRPSVTIQHTCDGRKFEELRDALGLFARAVPLTCGVEGETRFDQLLSVLEGAASDAYEWQEYFQHEPAASSSDGVSDASRVGFEFVERPRALRSAGVVFSIREQWSRADRFKVKLTCTRAGSALVATFEYDATRYRAEDVERLAARFDALLRRVVENPRAAVGRLNILSEAERGLLLGEWGRGAAAGGDRDEVCLHTLFEEQARRTPRNVALAFGEERLTYAELNARANRLAHRLHRLGVGPEVAVGLCVKRSLASLVGMLAVLKAGGAYVPLDPEHPAARRAAQLAEVRSPVLVTEGELGRELPEFDGTIISLDGDGSQFGEESESDPESSATPQNLCYVIYTSGSTGSPKGVAVSHANLVNYVRFILRTLEPHTRAGGGPLSFATVSTLTADLGNTCVFPALVSGGCLHVLSYEVAMDGQLFADYLKRHPIDVLKIVPSHLKALLGASSASAPVLPRRCLLLGGEAFPFELRKQIEASSAGCRVINHYGPTETTVGSLTFDLAAEAEVSQSAATVPTGRPIAETEIYILDDLMRPSPVGVAGELYIGGAGLARGYVSKPEQTAERFVPNPFSRGAHTRLYRTGDLARFLEDGSVEFLGRADGQVKIRGYRVEPGEVRAALAQHAAVGEAFVIAREDEPGHKRLVAYVVAAKGRAPSVTELRGFLSERLPEYMIPSAFVTLGALPLTPNGKVDRHALPAPGEARPELQRAFVGPRDEAEERLAEIWGEVLGVERVGVHDNFFELGGDSILSLQIIARAGRAGLRLTPKQLFEHPTIAALAEVAEPSEESRVEQGIVTGQVELTPIQQWFFERQLPDPHHWNMALLLEARQALDPTLLEKAVAHLLVHHDALRARFESTESGWRQFVAKPCEAAPVSVVDLSALPAAERGAKVEAAVEELQASLHLSRGPLMRVAWFDFGADAPGRLLIIVHHLIIDGVSWRVLLEDVQTAYGQLSRGGRVALPPKTVSFKRWAERLADYARSESQGQELDYWLEASTADDGNQLPLDFPGGRNVESSTRMVTVALDEEETRALLHDVPPVYRTQINDVLLTALAHAFAGWTGWPSLFITLEGHGRESLFEDLDVSRTVGWFTTHFPVRLDVGASPAPGEALKAIKEQLRLIPNRGIGYGLLRYLGGDAEAAARLRELPEPQVSFNYLGRFDDASHEPSTFSPAPEAVRAIRAPGGERAHVIEVIGSVAGGRLQVSWNYSENLHRRDNVERLAQGFAERLRAIIAHCQQPEAGGFTPSDFPEAALSQQQLEKLLAGLGASKER